MDSPFDVLGLDPDADSEAIERAYRELVKEAHPDHGGSGDEFRRVRRAYEAALAATESAGADGFEPDFGHVRPPPSGTEGAASDEGATEEPETRVEFLNYDVLADHGWSLTDDDLFARAADAGLDDADYGEVVVESGETLLEAAEREGNDWPFACRGGACSNCAVALYDGEMPMPKSHVLPSKLLNRGIRLSCLAAPTSETAQIVFNVKHLPALDELLLPAGRFE